MFGRRPEEPLNGDWSDEALAHAREGSRRLGETRDRLREAAGRGGEESPEFATAAAAFTATFGAALDTASRFLFVHSPALTVAQIPDPSGRPGVVGIRYAGTEAQPLAPPSEATRYQLPPSIAVGPSATFTTAPSTRR